MKKIFVIAIALLVGSTSVAVPATASAETDPYKTVTKMKNCGSFKRTGGKLVKRGSMKWYRNGKSGISTMKYQMWRKGDMRCVVIWDAKGKKWESMQITRNYEYSSGTCYEYVFNRAVRAKNTNTLAMKYKDVPGTSERDRMILRAFRNDTLAYKQWYERPC